MANYIDLYDLLHNNEFNHRVEVARIATADDVLLQEKPKAQEEHWAEDCLTGTLKSSIQDLTRRVIVSAPVQAAGFGVSDLDLQGVVDGLLDYMVELG